MRGIFNKRPSRALTNLKGNIMLRDATVRIDLSLPRAHYIGSMGPTHCEKLYV